MTFLKCSQVLAISAILLAASGCNIDLGLNLFAFPDISGTWTFNAASLQDSGGRGVSCNASGYRLVIDQNDRARNFTGTYSGGRLTCVLQGDTILDRSANGTIVNGQLGQLKLSTNDVSFDFDTRDAHQGGFVSRGDRDRMDGPATWRIDFGGEIGLVNLSGSWEAVR